MNLTGITDFQEVLQKHFEDSLAVGKRGRSVCCNSLLWMWEQGQDSLDYH